MDQSVKLTYAMWLLQLVISSPLIHALGDPSQVPTRIRTRVSRLRGGRLTKSAIPPPFSYDYVLISQFWLFQLYLTSVIYTNS